MLPENFGMSTLVAKSSSSLIVILWRSKVTATSSNVGSVREANFLRIYIIFMF